jgi:hypothetical protein
MMLCPDIESSRGAAFPFADALCDHQNAMMLCPDIESSRDAASPFSAARCESPERHALPGH